MLALDVNVRSDLSCWPYIKNMELAEVLALAVNV